MIMGNRAGLGTWAVPERGPGSIVPAPETPPISAGTPPARKAEGRPYDNGGLQELALQQLVARGICRGAAPNPCISSIQAAQTQLCSRATLAKSTKTHSSPGDIAAYTAGLVQAARFKRMAVKKPTQDVRDKQLREFESYLLTDTGRDLRTFIPGDFEAYFGGQWVHQHCRDGKLPSNSSVDSLI
jgi:hypothetical protein